MTDIELKSKLFKALGEPVRIKMIEYLTNNNECVCICNLSKFLEKDQSVVFRHVQILKDAGIIETRKDSKFLMCCIKNKELVRKYLEE